MFTIAGGILIAVLVLALLPLAFAFIGSAARFTGSLAGLALVVLAAGTVLALTMSVVVTLAAAADQLLPGAGVFAGMAVVAGLPAAYLIWDYRQLGKD